MRLFSLAGLGLGIVLSSFVPICRAGESEAKPNIVFVFFDQLRADVLGAYGGGNNVTTPNMDKLASQGVLFTNAISSTPLCTPYRGMLQTGCYPTHTGILVNFCQSNPNQRGVAHLFKEAGYTTGFIGKWHLAAGRNKTAGLHYRGNAAQAKRIRDYVKKNPEHEFVPPGGARMGYDHWEAYNFLADFNHYVFYRDTPQKIRARGFESDIIFDQGMKFMKEQQAAGRPFFVMLAPHPPHPPFQKDHCPPGYFEKAPAAEDIQWSPNVPKGLAWCKSDEARCYYAMCKNADDNVGRLLKFLDESGLAKNTIVVLTSDHGDMLASHGRHNKMVPYREAMNIPLIMRWPGHIPAGVRVKTVYTPIDHFPTLCALAGLDAPQGLDGKDLSRAVLGKGDIDRDGVLIANYTSHWDYCDSGTLWPEWRGVRTRRYTYVKWLKGGEELYDHQQDPYEVHNLAKDPEYAPLVGKLRKRMETLLQAADDEFLPGSEYAKWFDDQRNIVRTGRGPIERSGGSLRDSR